MPRRSYALELALRTLALQLAQTSNLVACGAACGACENVGRWLEAIQLLRYTAGAGRRAKSSHSTM